MAFDRFNVMRDKFPVVERTIQLTPDEVTGYRRKLSLTDTIRRNLSEIVSELLDEAALREEDFWDQVARRFGYDNNQHLHNDGKSLQVDYLTRQIELRGLTPTKAEDAGGGAEPNGTV